MNGLVLKVILPLALLFTLSPALTFANKNDVNESQIYRSSLGCMACHQPESIREEQPAKAKAHHQRHQPSVKNAILD